MLSLGGGYTFKVIRGKVKSRCARAMAYPNLARLIGNQPGSEEEQPAEDTSYIVNPGLRSFDYFSNLGSLD